VSLGRYPLVSSERVSDPLDFKKCFVRCGEGGQKVAGMKYVSNSVAERMCLLQRCGGSDVFREMWCGREERCDKSGRDELDVALRKTWSWVATCLL